MRNDELFQKPTYNLSSDDQKSLTLLQMKKLKEWNLLPFEEIFMNPKKVNIFVLYFSHIIFKFMGFGYNLIYEKW